MGKSMVSCKFSLKPIQWCKSVNLEKIWKLFRSFVVHQHQVAVVDAKVTPSVLKPVKSLQQLDWVPRNPGVPSIAIEGFEPTEQGASGGIYSVDCWVCLQMEPQFMASSMGNIMVNHQIIKSSIKGRESPHFSGKKSPIPSITKPITTMTGPVQPWLTCSSAGSCCSSK